MESAYMDLDKCRTKICNECQEMKDSVFTVLVIFNNNNNKAFHLPITFLHYNFLKLFSLRISNQITTRIRPVR